MFLKNEGNHAAQDTGAVEAHLMNVNDRHIIPAPIEQTHTIKLPVVLTRNAILKETLIDRKLSGCEKTGHDSSDVSLLLTPW